MVSDLVGLEGRRRAGFSLCPGNDWANSGRRGVLVPAYRGVIRDVNPVHASTGPAEWTAGCQKVAVHRHPSHYSSDTRGQHQRWRSRERTLMRRGFRSSCTEPYGVMCRSTIKTHHGDPPPRPLFPLLAANGAGGAVVFFLFVPLGTPSKGVRPAVRAWGDVMVTGSWW